MEPYLLIHNIGAIGSIALLIGLIILTIFKKPRRIANVTLAFTLLATAVFYISHVVGINIIDSLASRDVFMFSLSIIWIGVFLNHCVLASIGKNKSRRVSIFVVYILGLTLTAFYLVVPDSFFLASIPKLYFPNYYVPGNYHFLMLVVFNLAVPIYFIGEVVASYRKANLVLKNRLKYFLFALFLGYGGGFMMIFLIYNIPVDPNWGVLFAFFFAIPFVYAVLKYELLDIRIIAKRAFIYAVLVVVVSLILILVAFASERIATAFPTIPRWLVPGLASLVAVIAGTLVWRKLKEVDILKYEFITVVTHKFRTPLTHIKWSAENLANSVNPDERKGAIEEILNSNTRLVELTNTLIGLSKDEGISYLYKFEKIAPGVLVDRALDALTYRIKKKNLSLRVNESVTRKVSVDAKRFEFALGIILENAVMYTPRNGVIAVDIIEEGRKILMRVKDSGVGVPKEELPYIFGKFFRGNRAKLIDTEGLGVGLFMARSIIERNNGSIRVDSGGENKGTAFTIALPSTK